MEWEDGVKSSVPIEMASFLAPGYTFQDKKIVSQSICDREKVRIISLEKVDQISEHYQYSYKTDKGVMTFSGFELARVLFFHNPHLIRAVYTANGLSELAFIKSGGTPIEINFPQSTKYPYTYIRTMSKKTHLAWMLLDREAGKSAFSVFESFHDDQGDQGFKFVPPNLDDWSLEVSVRPGSEGTFEVVRVENILEAIFNENATDVLVSHPKDKGKSQSDGVKEDSASKGQVRDDDIDPLLDLGEIPGFGNRIHAERLKGFSFRCPAIRNVSSSKRKKGSASKLSSPPEDRNAQKEKAGLGLAEKDGEAQEFSPSINQDEEVAETVNLPKKFGLFSEVVEEVAKSDGVRLLQEAKCYRFPAPTNNSKVVYRAKYEGRLKYFLAIVEVKSCKLVIVEADNSNLKTPKGASTLILGLKEDAKTNFDEVLQLFSDSGAQWCHKLIQERCNIFIPCKHPSIKEKGKVRTDLEYKEKWVSDLCDKLKVLKSALK